MTRLLLVGAGHVNLLVASRCRPLVEKGWDVTVVSPGAFWYSGMATGMLGGVYGAEDDQVNPESLAARHGVKWVQGRVVGLEPSKGAAVLASGVHLGFDFLVLNVGSEVRAEGVEVHAPRVWPVKPIVNLWRLRRVLQQRLETGERVGRVAVVGGGATGCEVAANLRDLARRHGADLPVTLYSRSERLLKGYTPGAAACAKRVLERTGVVVRLGSPVARVANGRVYFTGGTDEPFDYAVVATGLHPPRWLQGTELRLAADGGIAVSDTLQSLSHPHVFAAGDCATILPHMPPKLGVFAVRAAPVVRRNVELLAAGQPLRSYRPQRRYLSILNMGGNKGLATWDSLWWFGRASWRWKDRIDRRFLADLRGAGEHFSAGGYAGKTLRSSRPR